ncbi:hypothetical protein NADFUDRAFT_51464 [Nadsonia fulvescens var. elongata DSM 6958]|uniref:Uncharacterized protein n=1 Tax=Nadsonia fulvescens var. elongata DSM 6958 TaxID=857566 RepID=A0A1E3PI17_9ASCO|nr:hypothetical protein NADFUDRAFT_51464 [Nadsonia fulvescens var. elongata DSM 6958]
MGSRSLTKDSDDIELGPVNPVHNSSYLVSTLSSLSIRSHSDTPLEGPDSFLKPKAKYKQSQWAWAITYLNVFVNLGIEISLVWAILYHYDELYKLTPIGVSAIISSAFSGLSQGLLQAFHILDSNRNNSETIYFNSTSILKFYTWGVFNGVCNKLWFDFLYNGVAYIPLRVLMDQGLGNPTNILLYLIFSSLWENCHNNHLLAVKINFWRILKASWIIWPIFSVLAFRFLSDDLIVPVSCLLNLIWSIILALVSG